MVFGTFMDLGRKEWEKISTTGPQYGNPLVKKNLLTALLRSGSFDEYHLFSPNYLSEKAKSEWKRELRNITDESRVHIWNMFELENVLSEKDFTVFYATYCLHQHAYLRSCLSRKLFPITVRIDTISYNYIMEKYLFLLLFEDELYPFDSIICPSSDAKSACMNLISCVSESMERRHGIKLRYPGRFDLIPSGVDSDIHQPRSKGAVRKLLNLPQDSLIILCFGRLSAHDKMDILPLLRAFKRVLEESSDEDSNILLLLAGHDTFFRYSKKVENFAQELQISNKLRIVKNPGAIENPLIYSAADIFVSFSDNLQEAFGITVLEAMSAGLPVVVSDWDGYKDTVVHGETGFRVPTYWAECEDRISRYSLLLSDWRPEHLYLAQSVCVDEDLMVKYLLDLVRNTSLRNKLGENARAHILKNFDWKIIIKKYEQLWDELYRQAQSEEKRKPKKPLFKPERFKTFRSYPSLILEKDPIVITNYGRSILEKKESLKFYDEMRLVLLSSVIEDGLKLSAQPTPFEELVTKLMERSRKDSLTRQEIRYQLLWTMKQGLIKKCEGISQ